MASQTVESIESGKQAASEFIRSAMIEIASSESACSSKLTFIASRHMSHRLTGH